MELRDEFAREVMKEMNWTSDPERLKDCAEACYAIADAMMAARGVAAPPEGSWIVWSGGYECPVPKGAKFSIRFRCGEENNAAMGGIWDWTHDDESDDYGIIAYRIDK